MKVVFENRHFRELYETGHSRKYRLPDKVVRKFAERIRFIEGAVSIHDLMQLTSLHFERLQGSNDLYSIRIDIRYRLEFELIFTVSSNTPDQATIIELSNHYGD